MLFFIRIKKGSGKMKETDLDLIEIEVLKALIQPHRDNRIDSKRARFFKAIDRKLDLLAEKRADAIDEINGC
jgi:hypothetical protein